MKAIYNKPSPDYPGGSLRELPEIKEPIWNPEGWESWTKYLEASGEHKKYIDSLKIISCSSHCKFEDGKTYEEGKDYELKYERFANGRWLTWVKDDKYKKIRVTAIPITQSDEDELWEEVVNNLGDEKVFEYKKFIIDALKSQFTITRKISKHNE